MGNFASEKYYLNKTYHTPSNILINANSIYIISIDINGLLIFCLDSNSYTISIQPKEPSRVDSVEMHPNYKNIFLSTYRNEIIIWEINESEKICEVKINIKDHRKNISKALF